MQCVSLERKIEGVTADLTRWLQPGGEGELPGLARKGTRQQTMLDLRRQRQRNRALSPLEEIGVPAVRNDHVRQEVRRQSHIGHRPLKREVLQPQLQNTDRFTAAGYRREQASSTMLAEHLDGLGGQRSPVRRPDHRHPLRRLLSLQPEWPSRISDRPLKSAIRKLTSRAPIASANAPASTSTAATGGAASTAASNEFKFRGECGLSPTSPNLARLALRPRDRGSRPGRAGRESPTS